MRATSLPDLLKPSTVSLYISNRLPWIWVSNTFGPGMTSYRNTICWLALQSWRTANSSRLGTRYFSMALSTPGPNICRPLVDRLPRTGRQATGIGTVVTDPLEIEEERLMLRQTAPRHLPRLVAR